jgi:hypothetical protein
MPRVASILSIPIAMVDASILAKKGTELFRELLRVYPTAIYEDYYAQRKWNDTWLKIDIQLVYQHRKQAGAPDPKPLEEVELQDSLLILVDWDETWGQFEED